MARAHERGDRAQRRRGGDDALADDRVAADELPLGVVERGGLVEDRVGDRDLADVVQRGGVADVVDLLLVEPQAAGDRLGQLGHAADVLAQLGVALGQRAQQHVAALAARRAAAAVLVRVHALVGDAQRLAGVVRLARAPRWSRTST